MDDNPKIISDCYAAGEREGMLFFQRCRAYLLGPLLRWLTRRRVTANHVTMVSLLVGLGFCAAWWQSPQWGLLCLLLHVLLDGLDGPVARHQETASAQGSLTDSLCDQIVVTASTIVLMMDTQVSIIAGSIYIFTYAIVVAFAMIRNAMQIPYTWLARPRFIVYSWLALDAWVLEPYAWTGSLEYVLWLCNIALSIKLVSGFFAIRRKLT